MRLRLKAKARNRIACGICGREKIRSASMVWNDTGERVWVHLATGQIFCSIPADPRLDLRNR
jgi:hypothetical protein